MDNNDIKKEVKIDNSAYMDRFRFLLTANDDIICERYFKINYFNYAAFVSSEMRNTIEDIVALIKRDLVSKSRIYEWHTCETPVKITGFLPNGMGLQNPNSEYITYPPVERNTETPDNTDEVHPYDVTFKFELQMAQTVGTDSEGKPTFSNYKKVYQAIWDGTVYPKDIRHRVDLTNSMAPYKNRDLNFMNFVQTLNYHMVLGRQDLVYEIIKMICETSSGEGKRYTTYSLYGTSTVSQEQPVSSKKIENRVFHTYVSGSNEPVACDVYSDKDGVLWAKLPTGAYRKVIEYSYDPYGQYVRSWERAVKEKTDAYRASIGFYGKR